MPSRKFAVTIDYPDELSTDDVREWVTAALDGAAAAHRLVVESVGSHCYGYVLKGYIEVSAAREVDEEGMKQLLEAPPGRGPKLTALRLL